MILRAFLTLVIVTLALLGLLAPTVSAAQFTILPNDIYAGWSVRPSSDVARSVMGQWTVPAVQCDANPLTNFRPWRQSRAGVWVGIWGQKNDGGETTWLAQIGTASVCGSGGHDYIYKAVAQLFHRPCPPTGDCPGSRPPYPGGYQSPGPYTLADVNVKPGDIVTASVTYYGRQPDNRLKYEAFLGSSSGAGSQQILMLTDPGVAEAAAAWQSGCIVESEPDGDKPLFGPLLQPVGGLAQFTTPITFSPFCSVNGRGLESYSGFSNLFRWDMKPDGKVLADTGNPGKDGAFSVIWRDWR